MSPLTVKLYEFDSLPTVQLAVPFANFPRQEPLKKRSAQRFGEPAAKLNKARLVAGFQSSEDRWERHVEKRKHPFRFGAVPCVRVCKTTIFFCGAPESQAQAAKVMFASLEALNVAVSFWRGGERLFDFTFSPLPFSDRKQMKTMQPSGK